MIPAMPRQLPDGESILAAIPSPYGNLGFHRSACIADGRWDLVSSTPDRYTSIHLPRGCPNVSPNIAVPPPMIHPLVPICGSRAGHGRRGCRRGMCTYVCRVHRMCGWLTRPPHVCWVSSGGIYTVT